MSSDPTTDPPDPNPAEETGDGLPDVPEPSPDPDPAPSASLKVGEAVPARGGCPPFPPPAEPDEPTIPPDRRLGLLELDDESSFLGLRGSSSASAASRKAAAWRCW